MHRSDAQIRKALFNLLVRAVTVRVFFIPVVGVAMRCHLLPTVRGGRVALLLVAGALLSPQRASAECGSHVTVLNPTAESRHDSMPQHASTDQSAPVKPPCQGPNCSGAPDRHAPPPAPPVSPGGQVKELVVGGGLLDRDDPTHSPFNRAGTAARPIHRSLSIFHPPRAG
jgi:hypothetical protein